MDPHSRQLPGLLACIGFCMLLAAIGLLTHGYVRTLNSDERIYYAPAITFVTHALPHLPLRDYPFPAPPLALWVQAVVASAFPGWLSIRLFSSVCAAGLAAYLLLRAGKGNAARPLLGTLALLCFPFFLWNSFTIKQHVLTVSCLLIGLDCWCREEESAPQRAWRNSGIFFTAAMLSNQFCAPLFTALCWDGLRRWRTLSPSDRRGLVSCAVPLVCLGLLVLYWGGRQPPMYLNPLPPEIVPGWRSRLAQFVVGMVSVGAWLGVPSCSYRVHGKIFLLALLPSMAAVWLSQAYAPEGNFWTTGQGPISTVLVAALHRLPVFMMLAAGAFVALAVAFWISPGVPGAWARRLRAWVAIYLGMATLAVPYLFESYYLLLILPVLFVLGRHSTALETSPRRTALYFGGVILLGITYSIFKLRQLT